jgi:DNA-binding transcriptional LysR family regulator
VPRGLAGLFEGAGLQAIPIVEPEAEHSVGLITARRDPQTPVLGALIDEALRYGARHAG